MGLFQPLRQSFGAGSTSAAQKEEIDRSGWEQAAIDAHRFANRPWAFTITCTVWAGIGAALGAYASSGCGVWPQVLLTVGGAVAGLLLLSVALRLWFWLRAIPWQRDRARTRLRNADTAAMKQLAEAEDRLAQRDRLYAFWNRLREHREALMSLGRRSRNTVERAEQQGIKVHLRQMVEDVQRVFDDVATTLREQGEEFGRGNSYRWEGQFDLEYNPPAVDDVLRRIDTALEEIGQLMTGAREYWWPAPWNVS